MARTEITATITKITSFDTEFGTSNVYIFTAEDNTVYSWITSSCPAYEEDNSNKWRWELLEEGDICTFTATIKGVKTYKGVEQIQLTRCSNFIKVGHTNSIAEAKAKAQKEREDKRAQKKAEQLASIKEGDFIWTMPYRQYKTHYADCETVIDSFAVFGDDAEIDVIIRKGRLVNSGVRGKHYDYFTFRNKVTGERVDIKAISEETAQRRLGSEWELDEDATGRFLNRRKFY